MKMEIMNKVIHYYSGGLSYPKERSGEKNNAVCVISDNTYVNLKKLKIDEICVIDEDTDKCFTRRVTDISLVGNIAGCLIIVITWKVEK